MGRLGAEIANLRAGFGPNGSMTIRCGTCDKAADSVGLDIRTSFGTVVVSVGCHAKVDRWTVADIDLATRGLDAVPWQAFPWRMREQMPVGGPVRAAAPKPLAGLEFCVTGRCSRSREAMHADILLAGGSFSLVVRSVTDYLVTGDAPGASKLAGARRFGIEVITEVAFDAMRIGQPLGASQPVSNADLVGTWFRARGDAAGVVRRVV